MAVKEDVIKAIEGMNVLELSDLVKELQEKFGVSGQMAMSAGPAVAAPGAAAVVEEKTAFTVFSSPAARTRYRLLRKSGLLPI